MRLKPIRTILVVAAALSLLLGCMNPLEAPDATEDMRAAAIIEIEIGGTSARTVMPTNVAPTLSGMTAAYSVTLSRTGHTDRTESGTSGPFSFPDLPIGTWQVAVEARDATDGTIAAGTAEVDVAVDGANTAQVSLLPLTTGTGSVDLTFSWPTGEIDALQSATLTPQGGTATDITSAFVPSGDTATYAADLSAGVYTLAAEFGLSGTHVATVVEAVNVYHAISTTDTIEVLSSRIGRPPAAPTNLDFTVTGPNAFTLTWTDNGSTDEGYRIYETSLDGVPEGEVSDGVPEATSAEIAYSGSVGDSTDYYVTAFNDFGESPAAAVTVAMTSFVSRWKTDNFGPSADNQITLPLVDNGSYNFEVDWGDGSSDVIAAWDDPAKTHTYASIGEYTVTISGLFSGWSFTPTPGYPWNADGDAPKIIEISAWGPVAFGATQGQFLGANQLTITATDIPDLSETTSLRYAFHNAGSLTTVPNMGQWDTSGVTNMSNTFKGAMNFNADIGGWDTSNVTNMNNTFDSAKAFNQDISGWDTSSVTAMRGTFLSAWDFNQPLGTWDTSSVTTMQEMFRHATVFNQPIGSWDTSNVTKMHFMFHGAEAFNADISGWDVSKVTTMESMLRDTTVFNQPIGSWDVSNVTDMRWMFGYAAAFNQDLSAWDTSSVTSMLSMFHNATVFNGDITTWNTGAVTDMRKMFFEAPVFNQDIRGWDTSNVTTMQETFRSAAAFNQPIGGWDTSSVTDMQYMFYGATAFDQDLSSWNVAGVTNMTQMFDSVTLSTANYDALLVGWESQAVQSGVTFDGGGSQYTSGSAAATARQALIDDHGWIITDGGSAP